VRSGQLADRCFLSTPGKARSSRKTLRLNTVVEARELVRAWAETMVDNTITPGLVGRLRYPYKTRAEVPGDVEVFGADGSVEAVI
jgi:hypothetical protein